MLDIKDLFDIQKQFSDLFFDSKNLSDEEREEITKSFALSLHGKVSSFVNEINIKDHILEKKDPNIQKMLYLAADSLRYSIALMNLWNIPYNEFQNAFLKKEAFLQIRNKISQKKWQGEPVVIFDVDDVISSFRKNFCDWMRDVKKLNINYNSNEYYLIKDLAEQGQSSEDLFEEFMNLGHIATLGLEEGALDLLKSLKDQGFWIHLLTARPQNNLNCFYDTYIWLDSNNVIFDDITLTPEKMIWLSKTEYYSQGKIVCCVDDSPKHANEFAKHGIQVISPIKTYNNELEDVKNVQRYNNWYNALKYIQDLYNRK